MLSIFMSSNICGGRFGISVQLVPETLEVWRGKVKRKHGYMWSFAYPINCKIWWGTLCWFLSFIALRLGEDEELQVPIKCLSYIRNKCDLETSLESWQQCLGISKQHSCGFFWETRISCSRYEDDFYNSWYWSYTFTPGVWSNWWNN